MKSNFSITHGAKEILVATAIFAFLVGLVFGGLMVSFGARPVSVVAPLEYPAATTRTLTMTDGALDGQPNSSNETGADTSNETIETVPSTEITMSGRSSRRNREVRTTTAAPVAGTVSTPAVPPVPVTSAPTAPVASTPTPPVVTSSTSAPTPVPVATSSAPVVVPALVTTPVPVPVTTVVSTPSQSSGSSVSGPATTVTHSFPVGFAVGDTLTGLSVPDLNTELDTLVKLGVTWIRIDFDWSWMQPKSDRKIEWFLVDQVVTAANARGLKILPIIVYTPSWAQRSDCAGSVRCQPANPADYASFAQQVAARYAPFGIHAWEIWNEPNVRGSWLPSANPTEYAAILQQASKAIKSVDPTATIVTGGLSPAITTGGDIAPVDFLSALYTTGVQASFDAVGWHPYSYPALPSEKQSWSGWQQMAYTAGNARAVMVSHGDTAKKIWITEYGAPTGGPGQAAPARASYLTGSYTHTTEKYQAEMLTDAIAMLKSVTWAGPFFWYSYKDLGTSSVTIENHFGILRYDGTQKPIYDVFTTSF